MLAKMDAILSFWIAYILTRPLGASMGDFVAKPVIAGGLGWGTVTTSIAFLAVILLLVVYLTISKSDRISQEPRRKPDGKQSAKRRPLTPAERIYRCGTVF